MPKPGVLRAAVSRLAQWRVMAGSASMPCLEGKQLGPGGGRPDTFHVVCEGVDCLHLILTYRVMVVQAVPVRPSATVNSGFCVRNVP